ncbi:MAG: hypothetical protein ABH858_01495 [Candidatus Omnitrophota bacterium]
MKNKLLIIFFISFSFVNSIYAVRIDVSSDQQRKEADCVLAGVLLKSHPVSISNTKWEESVVFTIFEFQVKKDIQEWKYSPLVGENICVISQTSPEWTKPEEAERYAPKFDYNKEYILFLKETPTAYLFNFVQDFRNSVEYNDEALNQIAK